MRYLIFLMIAICPVTIIAQLSDSRFQESVRENNKELIALKKLLLATQAEAKTGLTPENPYIEYGYFPGNTPDLGTKEVFSVSQSFEFPTVYKYQKAVSKNKIELAKLSYQLAETEILLDARLKYCQLVYFSKMLQEHQNRYENAKMLNNAYQLKFDAGGASILERNKVKLRQLNEMNNLNNLNTDLLKLKKEMFIINGSNEPNIPDTAYPVLYLPGRDTIINRILELHPKIKIHEIQEKDAQLNVNLNKQNRLPAFEIGYESESVLDEVYRGLKAGITVPLWHDKNKLKASKLTAEYVVSATEQEKELVIAEYEKLYDKALSLKKILQEFNNIMTGSANIKYLDKALDLRQISVVDYYNELESYYEIIDSYLDTEFEYHKAMARLRNYINP